VTRLLHAELIKLRTTQVWFWLLLLGVAVSALVVVGGLASNSVKSADKVPDLFGNANGALITAFVLGILGITTEFRHQTITPTLLATPSRWSVVGAKLFAYALTGVGFAAVCVSVQLAIALPWLAARGIDFRISDGDVARAVFGPLILFLLFAVLGVGVGSLIRNQVVSLVLGLVFLLAINNIIPAIPVVKSAYAYTPAGATTEIVFPPGEATPGGVHLIGMTGGILVLLLWSLVPALVGAAYSLNRDIT
jgi:hypothetical protein